MVFIGNKKAVSFIEKVLQKGTTSQAYLFSGPENVGKFFLARIFAKGLINDGELNFNDDNGGVDGPLVDLTIIRPEIEEKKGVIREKDIPIEKVREVCRSLSLYPHSGKRKVLIVDNAHRMNITSQNAFLKTLEEPNSTSVIILVTQDDSNILPTIKSRCQKVNFGLVGDEMISKLSESLGKEFVEKYAVLAMGRPGLFFAISQDKEKFGYYLDAYAEFEKISNWDLNQRLFYVEKMSKDMNVAMRTLNIWSWTLRKSALARGAVQINDAYAKISAIEKTLVVLKSTNANSRLILENLLINI